ncbi:hypothetical protein HZA56_00610 [Candidatus Poribacteria bacterium]|nr:hypothetical protein [Candidatus Poribacteria bacterium]
MEGKNSNPAGVREAVTNTDLSPAATPQPSEAQSRVLARLLGMADRYRSEDALCQAADICFDLIENHEHSPEAGRAREHLMEIAEHYENGGQRRLARHLYERLL